MTATDRSVIGPFAVGSFRVLETGCLVLRPFTPQAAKDAHVIRNDRVVLHCNAEPHDPWPRRAFSGA